MNKISRPLSIEANSFSAFKSISKRISLFVIGVGCLVLMGWALDLAALKSVVPGLASMKSNTALLFILSSSSLWMQVRGQTRRIAQICAVIVAFVALLTLGEYLIDRDFGIDQLLFRDTAINAVHPGRMSPATALAFLLIGSALIFLNNQSRNRFRESWVLATFAISALALIGYLYGVSSLYQIGAYSSMALHTALSFSLLALGVLFAQPERGLMHTILADTAGGNILRRLLPMVLVGPVLLGWVRLWGQRAGLYDTAFGLALMVISLITTLTIFIWLNAGQLTTIDIKRRQVDDSLRESEERFRLMVEQVADYAIFMLDEEGTILSWNVGAERMKGYKEAEIIGQHISRFQTPEQNAAGKTSQLLRQAEAAGHVIDENWRVRKDGSRFWAEVTITALRDEHGNLRGFSKITQNLTVRKQAEEALRTNERRLHLAASARGVGIWDWDVLKDELIWDESMYSLYNIRKKDFSGAYHAWSSTLHPDDRKFTEAQIQAALRGEREYAPEFRIVRPDGVVRVMKATSQTIRDQDGKALRMIGTNIDITERKQVESEILKLNAELEEKVARRTAELAAANEQLHELSIVDELTGLYNRRGFLLLAEEQLLLARRTKRNLLIFYADLDRLKQINDLFGHIAGDEAIVTAARVLNETFRTSDIKARLGGDEFIVLAVEAKEYDTQTLLSRLHDRLTENNQTMSVGMVTFDAQNETSIEDLIARADKAMYIEKRKKPGRDVDASRIGG